MELIKKDSDFYNLIEKQCPCYGMETGNYDPFTHKFINEIFKKDENGKYVNHSKEKWKNYIKDTDIAHIEKQIQQIAIARHPLLSDEMAKELINLKNINKGTLKSLLKRNDLTYSTIKETYDLLNKRFPYAMSELFIDSTQPEIGRDVIKILTIDAVSEISSNGKAKNIAQEYVFLYTRENRLISDWLSAEGNNIPEDILSRIASNENLLSSIRDTAFNIGCNWEKIDNFTTKMSESVYPNIIAYPFNDNRENIISTDQKIKEKLFYFSLKTLTNFVINECLPVANKRDLLNRLFNMNPSYDDSLGKIFISFIDHEKDIAILKDIASLLEFSITDNQSYLTHLLMNPEFQKTELFERTVNYLFLNAYDSEPCNKKVVTNLIKSLYAYPCDQTLQNSIVNETLKNKEKKYSFSTQKENQESILMALLHSKYTNIETYDALINNKAVTPDLLLLGHFGKCCHNAYEENTNTEKIQHIKEIFFKCIKYNRKSKCFLINIDNKSEYKLVSKVIKNAKQKMPKKFMIKNKSTLSYIESLVKKHEKKIIKDELMNKLFDIEKRVLDLNHKDASNFYIHISELQEEFEVIQEKLNNFKKRKEIITDNEKDISHNDDEIR